jgi:hypothetical protein
MKNMHRFASNLFASAAALAMIAFGAHASAQTTPTTTAPATPDATIKVVQVSGDARYSMDKKNWQKLKKGTILTPGTVIQTGKGESTVDLVLGDRGDSIPQQVVLSRTTPVTAKSHGSGVSEVQPANVVHLFPDTVLSIDKLTSEKAGEGEVTETQLDLQAGQIMGNVKKLSAASKYEIKIPNGVAGIRGTTYLIAASGVVNVLTGSVVVAVVDKNGSVVTRVVTAGFRYDPASDRISPIPGPQLEKLIDLYHTLNYPPQTPPTSYPKDHTIVYVSPTQ